MIRSSRKSSLLGELRKAALRWSLLATLCSALAASATLYISYRSAAEDRASTLAVSLVQAFRPAILRGEVRDSQFQMNTLVEPSNSEFVRVLDETYAPIYELDEANDRSCGKVGACWRGLERITYIQPIFFDSENKTKPFGYLEVGLPIRKVPGLTWVLAFLMTIGFWLQIFATRRSVESILARMKDILSTWARHISSVGNAAVDSNVLSPFEEFGDLEAAIRNLHLQVAELESRAAEKAKNAAQISIVRQIGHDLKTPLSQLSKVFYLISNGRGSSESSFDRHSAAATRALKRMGDLIRQIREFDSPQRLGSEPLKIGSEISAIVGELTSYNSDLEAKGVALSFADLCDGALVAIPRIKLFQLVDNLVRNSIDAIPCPGGIISVRLSLEGSYVAISVADNGHGVPKEIRSRVFDADFTTKPGRGTGLGLSIVKEICNEFDGSVSISSSESSGTVVRVDLPIAKWEVRDEKNLGGQVHEA